MTEARRQFPCGQISALTWLEKCRTRRLLALGRIFAGRPVAEMGPCLHCPHGQEAAAEPAPAAGGGEA